MTTHRTLAAAWTNGLCAIWRMCIGPSDVDDTCRQVGRSARQRWLAAPCGAGAYGGERERLDSRSLCLIRETLARHAGLADFAFAMQGLGSGAIALHGSEELKQRYLPRSPPGKWIAAFALSEPDAGSDVAAMTTSARLEGDRLRARRHQDLDLERRHRSTSTRSWRARGEAPGAKGLTAFVVDADTPGLEIASAST